MHNSRTNRSVLFLQGPPSIFWRELADSFETQGSKTHRVNFSLGDRIFWTKRGALNFKKSLSEWPEYLGDLIIKENITDILYYGDQFPYHRAALQVARRLGVKCFAIEYGYLRPDWLTLERDGMGKLSHFPDQPEQISAIAKQVGPADLVTRYPHKFWVEATNEVVYHLSAYFGRPFFPKYHSDKVHNPFLEYLTWLPKLVRKRKLPPEKYLKEQHPSFFLLALQLQSDYQIRANSPYKRLSDMLEQVIDSFKKHAPEQCRLLIKRHPLDHGLDRWGKVVAQLADKYHVAERVDFIDAGDLGALLRKSSGVVVVNSTVGLTSLSVGCPTIVLGSAVYDVEGLTHQNGLDNFWSAPSPVDSALCNDFINALAATIQVKGDFFNKAGRKIAITEIVHRVLNDLVNCPDAYIETPPRLGGKRKQ